MSKSLNQLKELRKEIDIPGNWEKEFIKHERINNKELGVAVLILDYIIPILENLEKIHRI